MRHLPHRSTISPLRRTTVGVCVAAALAVTVIPSPAEGQELPFVVTIVDWDRSTVERQRRAYRSEATDHEVLFCIESWTRTAVGNGIERIVITGVRRAHAGRKHHIDDVDGLCVGRDGKALPMFHTHSDGNCQLSPRDLVTLAVRGAAFEGVQCGERHFVWAFAWQVLAITAAAERERIEGSQGSPP
jgi:hypothetical protein